MSPELDFLQTLDLGSFLSGSAAGTALTVITVLIVENLRWTPKNLFRVTRQLLGKRGLVGLAESVGSSLLIDGVKLPYDLFKGIYRKPQPSQVLLPGTPEKKRRRRSSDQVGDLKVATLRQAFTKKVIEGNLENLQVDMSAGNSPRVTGSVTMTKEDAPWLT